MDLNNRTKRAVYRPLQGPCFLILTLLAVSTAYAQEPKMAEQMVYRLRLFKGKDYQESFCPPTEDTIYVISDSDNVFDPKMTLVYYWPISRRYKAAFKTLNETVDGILEILQGGKVILNVQPQMYTFSQSQGWYTGSTKILIGSEAKQRYEEYQLAVKTYLDRLKTYRAKKRAYLKEMEDLFEKAKKRQKLRNNSAQKIPTPVPKEPTFPSAPDYYVQQPARAYIINLPVGRYEMRLRSESGAIVEGSEKGLVSFTHRRTGKVGYEVVSAKRWTMPETSSDPRETIYLEGANTLYLRPYVQTEYNDLYYSKLIDPQNEGYSELWRWINSQQIEKGNLQVIKDGQIIASIEEQPYYVQQIPGPELGYKIIDYKKEEFPDRPPSLVAHKIEFQPEKGGYQIQLVDEAGPTLSGSVRDLRTIVVGKPWKLYSAAVILPFVAWVPMFIWRRRKLK